MTQLIKKKSNASWNLPGAAYRSELCPTKCHATVVGLMQRPVRRRYGTSCLPGCGMQVAAERPVEVGPCLEEYMMNDGMPAAQLFFEVMALNVEISWTTFPPPHFGHLARRESCSLILIVTVNFFLHRLQRYS